MSRVKDKSTEDALLRVLFSPAVREDKWASALGKTRTPSLGRASPPHKGSFVERKAPLLSGAQLVSLTKFKHLMGTVGPPRKPALPGFWELPDHSSSLLAKMLAMKVQTGRPSPRVIFQVPMKCTFIHQGFLGVMG